MTLTAPSPPQTGTMATGHISQIIGPVVDVVFPPDQLPEIYFALEVDLSQIVGTGDGKASGESAAMKGVCDWKRSSSQARCGAARVSSSGGLAAPGKKWVLSVVAPISRPTDAISFSRSWPALPPTIRSFALLI